MGPELITEGSKYDQTLMQGSYKLNRGHRNVTHAEAVTRTRVVRAHSRLRQDDGGGSALMMRKVTLVTAVMKAREGSVRAEARLLQRTGHGGSGSSNGLRLRLRARLGRGKESEVAF